MSNVSNYREQGGSNWVIGGTVNSVAGSKISFCHRARYTIAQVNAGVEALPAITGKQYFIHGVKIRAIGGAAAAVTSVDVKDGAASPVTVISFAQAQLTENTLLQENSTGATRGAGFLVGTTASKAVNVAKNGSDVTTATHFDVVIEYTVG